MCIIYKIVFIYNYSIYNSYVDVIFPSKSINIFYQILKWVQKLQQNLK